MYIHKNDNNRYIEIDITKDFESRCIFRLLAETCRSKKYKILNWGRRNGFDVWQASIRCNLREKFFVHQNNFESPFLFL